MDAFADTVSDVINKGVVYDTNFSAGEACPAENGKQKTAENSLES